MQVGLAQCVNKGMQRDYSMDKASQEFAYENRNIRITTTGSNSFLSITNERSTEKINLKSDDGDFKFPDEFIILGTATIDNKLIVFGTTNNSEEECSNNDYIYKITNIDANTNTAEVILLYNGNLSFRVSNPIECITSYEGDEVQKVYWVDGRNTTRYINVFPNTQYLEEHSFDFTPIVSDGIDVSIEKQNSSGNFKSGIIQYFITGYQKFGAETNLLYQSPLYYISPNNRGGEIDEDQICSFKLTIKTNIDSITHARVYSMIRTSLDAEPQVSVVADFVINKESENVIIDTNRNNIPVAPTDLMFVGGNTIIASTIEQKNNTLFLGNIETKTSITQFDITKTDLESIELGFGIKYAKDSNNSDINEYYPYSPNMEGSSEDTTTFKYLEWYRVGIQFQTKTAEWTSTYPIGDIQNTISPNDENADIVYNPYSENEYKLALKTMLYAKLPKTLIDKLQKAGFISWRLTVAQHTNSTRTIKAQGLVLPTLYNIEEKANKKCGGTPLWTVGQAQWLTHNDNADTPDKNQEPLGETTKFHASHMLLSPSVYSKPESEAGNRVLTLLSNTTLYSTQVEESSDLFITSYKLRIWVDRIYTWSDNYTFWSFAGDVFAGVLEVQIKNADGSASSHFLMKEYKWGDNNVLDENRGVLPNHVIAYEKAPYGQRRSKLEALSSKLKSLTWEDLKDYIIYGLYKEDLTPYTVKEMSNFVSTDSVFEAALIPNGDALRDDYGVTASNNIIIDNIPLFFKDYSFSNQTFTYEKHRNNYFCDANLCNFYSPDINNVSKGNKFRIVGCADINNTISDYKVDVEDNVLENTIYKEGRWNLNRFKCPVRDIHENQDYFLGISSFPIWPFSNRLHFLQYWHQSGHIIETNSEDNNGIDKGTLYFKLKNKKYSNMWVFSNTSYFKDDIVNYYKIYNLEHFKGQDALIFNTEIYKGNYENLLVKPKDGYVIQPAIAKDAETHPINTTFPLEEIKKYIEDGDFMWLYREETPVSLKFKSAEHIVFSLPRNHIVPDILPNYTSAARGINSYFDTSNNIPTVNYVLLGNYGMIDNWEIFIDKSSSKLLSNAYIRTNPPSYDNYSIYVNNVQVIRNLHKSDVEIGLKTLFNHGIILNYNILLVIPYDEGYYYLYINNGNNKAEDSKDDYYNSSILYYFDSIENAPVFKYIKGDSGDAKFIKQKGENPIKFETYDFNIGSHIPSPNKTAKYWLGEFYEDYDENTFMGGPIWEKVEEGNYVLSSASKQLTFLPISGKYTFDLFESLNEDNELVPTDYALGYGLEGDTYYQRWDYVRTMPFSDNDENQNTDAFSIMVESYKNLDGDYRKLRGRLDALNLTVDNTNNVLNPIYNQTNNYITSSVLDEKFEDNTHPSLYLWSLQKTALSNIDNWTKLNLTSSNKLDADKGELTKIKNWNDKLIAFQEKGISIINFNEQTTISTSSGVPVEIANSGKVTGHYYLTTTQGCKNKWSVIDSPYGLYFIDSYNKSLNVFSTNGIKSLSTMNLFEDWIQENEKGIIWNPNNTQGFKSFYDPIHKEVYFVNDREALCYNELLQQFTSFYDYGNMNTLVSINGHMYGIKDTITHKMFEGNDYCNLFGERRDYSITYKINKDPFIDKTWTNIEYRADIFKSGNIGDKNSERNIPLETFDTLEVWNEYQNGITDLSKAKCKFRIWRADIPRDTKEGRGLNRIRNPWIMIKLSKEYNTDKKTNTDKRMEFHDLLIKYLQ